MALSDNHKTGIVFNIQKYSLHDGPGIRTIVFVKGCNLHCHWCSNPESQKIKPQIAYNSSKCITIDACGRCLDKCPNKAISVGDDNLALLSIDKCTDNLACADACPTQALNVYGYEISVSEVIEQVEEDSAFYTRSDGGMTLSGGEPYVQSEFALALLREAKRHHINTCIETAGNVPWETLKESVKYLNSMLYDIKCMDNDLHIKQTGAPNTVIIDNLLRLKKEFPEFSLTVRTPVVPGVNDTQEEIEKMVNLVNDLPNTRYELLAYHRMGMPKYEYLQRDFLCKDITELPKDNFAALKELARKKLGDRLVG